jgi:hypothetical protein
MPCLGRNRSCAVRPLHADETECSVKRKNKMTPMKYSGDAAPHHAMLIPTNIPTTIVPKLLDAPPELRVVVFER